jgi:hypothetical protein
MRFRKTLTSLILANALVFALSAWAQQKPLTKEQVSNMVLAGHGDESGTKLIEQRGIAFSPAEVYLKDLKAAGASEAFLNALRALRQPVPVGAKKPLQQTQILAMIAGEVPSHRLALLVDERGIDFKPGHHLCTWAPAVFAICGFSRGRTAIPKAGGGALRNFTLLNGR